MILLPNIFSPTSFLIAESCCIRFFETLCKSEAKRETDEFFNNQVICHGMSKIFHSDTTVSNRTCSVGLHQLWYEKTSPFFSGAVLSFMYS